MHILPENSETIAEALEILRNGGSIIHATETCYGIACDLSNFDAVAKMFGMKQRPMDMPVSALFASIDQAKEYVEWNTRADELAKEKLPWPLTLILPLKENPPHILFPIPAEGKTIGVRISSHPLAQELVEKFGKPISTTSANIHRHENPYSVEEIQYQFERQMMKPELVIDSGELPEVGPSRVINLCGEEEEILRK